MQAAAELPQFWAFQRQLLTVDVIGQAESWAAPVARLHAPDGFGESVWLDSMPGTVIAVRMGGAHVSKARGIGAGRNSACGSTIALQCGFADQSHFTTAFRMATGVTPAMFRREAKL